MVAPESHSAVFRENFLAALPLFEQARWPRIRIRSRLGRRGRDQRRRREARENVEADPNDGSTHRNLGGILIGEEADAV